MLKIKLSSQEIELVKKYSVNAELGGKSNIRSDTNRRSTLAGDQLTAQLGEAALSKFMTGSVDLYEKTRQERDLDKWHGDKGSDLLGYNVDVKTSRARRGLDFPYNLWVREREYHEDTIYFLAIVSEDDDSSVFFLGWCLGSEIKSKTDDRYEKNSRELRSMEPLASWFKRQNLEVI